MGKAIAAGGPGGGGRALRDVYHHERCVPQHGRRRLRAGRGVLASDPAEAGHSKSEARYCLCAVPAERRPVPGPRRDTENPVAALDLVKKVLPRQEWKEAGVRGLPSPFINLDERGRETPHPSLCPLLPRKDFLGELLALPGKFP